MVNEKNYITEEGFKILQDELSDIIKKERPLLVKTISWAAGNGDRSENGDYIYGKKKLRQIDARIKFLLTNIEDSNIVRLDNKIDKNKIFFGAYVSLFDEVKHAKLNIRIVGKVEINHKTDYISWISPLAKALLGKSVDDIVEIKTRDGERVYTILDIKY
tara:strand:- start:17207 stop:17686 length:480 start_codon:yes stop_codon:yes gene_type:complete